MKKILLQTSVLWFITINCYTQNQYNKQKADSTATEKFEKVSKFINILPTDVIADIGTGAGYSLIPLANNCPECKFSVEDIDSLKCNRKYLTKKINNTGNKTRIENFNFYYGTEKNTNLPSEKFNKVLVFDVIHEMTYKKEMLIDIKRILQKNGTIFIEEILVHKPEKKDRACNYPFLTEVEFKAILFDNNLIILRETTTLNNGKNKYFKIFECSIKP